MSQTQSPFSIRPIKAPGDRKPKNLAEFIARVNASRPGGFRTLDEADLRKQIEERKQNQNAGADTTDVHMEDGAGSEDEAETDVVKDLTVARMEVLQGIHTAYTQANNALQLVSLLMSKEVPTQVMGTIDPDLRNRVGIGSLGSTKLHEGPFFQQRLQENTMIATGGKLRAINNTANKLLAAATRLQNEMTVETEYWHEVLSIKDGGWPVSRLPSDPLTVAVKFGFSDSSAEFQANSWAALSREDDGSVNLQMPRLIAEPKRLVVSMEKDGKVFGRSSLPELIRSDAPLELRVREARNTILAQELWHELNREGRSLLAYNVRLLPSSVRYQFNDSTAIIFTLATLGDLPELSDEQEAKSGDGYAETICGALHLLLAYAHRLNARQRTQVQPLTKDQGRIPKPAYSLIKPLIAYLQHEAWLRSTMQFVSDLTATLRSAGIDTARYSLDEAPLPKIPSEGASERLLSVMLSPIQFHIHLSLTPQVWVVIQGTTVIQNRPTSIIRFINPAARPQPGSQTAPPATPTNLLGAIYQPADFYDSRRDAFQYLAGATTRALAKHFDILAADWHANTPPAEKHPTVWSTTIKGDAIRDTDTERRGVSFELLGVHDDQVGRSATHPSVPTLPKVTGLKVVGDQRAVQGGVVNQVWTWSLDDIKKDVTEQRERIEDIVRRVLKEAA